MESRRYTNGEITVFWRPKLCNHNGYCYENLESVFDPLDRPWVNMDGASTKEIADTVEHCPTGALTYKRNSELIKDNKKEMVKDRDNVIINVTPNGPFLIKGDFIIIDKDGTQLPKRDKATLCRCGASRNMPFCDGIHKEIDFRG
ncbi:MAG: (4Fe-4S)-binding protein [Bacteroidales bacterium]|jgi:uncharacterized Fe-S cluster protein YjdI